MVIPERVYQRVLHWADRDKATGCLISRYSVGSHGYAQVGWQEDGKRVVTLAHLVIWIYLEGEVPAGYTVDHKCHNRKCVERKCYRLLTNFDNARRTMGRDWPLGECIAGHPDSMLRKQPDGRLRCVPCNQEYQRRYNRKRKEIKTGQMS